MYQVLCNISNTNAPIIFKGALITKLALAENGYNNIERITRDIDANWIGTPPSNEELLQTINASLGAMGENLYAELRREHSDRKSAGIKIISKNTKDELVSMDISIKPVTGSRIYYYGDAKIKGVLPNEILADKICVLSSHLLFRRMKDMVDVYALSNCMRVKISEIFDVCSKKGIKIKGFDEFYSKKSDIEHAYNKLRGVEGKPNFDTIYSYMSEFLRPFEVKNKVDGIWDSNIQKWVFEQKKSMNRINNYLL